MLARTFFALAFAASGIDAKPCSHIPSQSTPNGLSIVTVSGTSGQTHYIYPLPPQATSIAGEALNAAIDSSAAAEPSYATDGSDAPVASNPAVEPTYATEPTDAPVATPSGTAPLPASETPPAGATVYSGGQASWYNQRDDHRSACGDFHQDTEVIVAISVNFDSNPKQHCGKNVHIVSDSGKTLNARIEDLCDRCLEPSLDLSVAAFRNFTDLSVGVFGIKWWMTDDGNSTSNANNTHNSGSSYNSVDLY